jgi:hypothetical protein
MRLIPLGRLAARPLMSKVAYRKSDHTHILKAIAPVNLLAPGRMLDTPILASIEMRPGCNILLQRRQLVKAKW